MSTQFDMALTAALLLAQAALRHGDAVGFSVFGAEERWIPLQRGPNALSFIVNAVYDIQSSSSPSSLFSALEAALFHLKRRTFIVLVSNFRKEDEVALKAVLKQAGRHHIVLLASIIEREVEELAALYHGGEPACESALLSAAAATYINDRKRMFSRWESQGFLTLESSAEALNANLIKRYLTVKLEGIL
jgi:uncharacterized protein (DUF58 family)